MKKLETKNREILKSFRTTSSLSDTLKKMVSLYGDKNTSESDIINDALSEYLFAFMNTNIQSIKPNMKSKLMNEFYYEKINKLLNEINHTKPAVINSPKDVAVYFKRLLPKNREAIYIMYLDAKNTLIKLQFQAIGTSNEAKADYSEVVKTALILHPCHFVFIHNHPGTGVTPSKSDIISTNKFYVACQFSRVAFADAIIIDDNNSYFSFADAGYLKKFEKSFLQMNENFNNKIKTK